MSRRYQILTAQVEAARKETEAKRARMADKAARYAVGADAFCKGWKETREVTRERWERPSLRELRKTFGGLDVHEVSGGPIKQFANAASWGTAPVASKTVPVPLQSSWRTATKQWHSGPPPHDGMWLSFRNSKPRIRRFAHGHWYSVHDKGRRLDLNDFQWFGYAPDADGWIKWDGGECPVAPDTTVDAVFSGDECATACAGVWDWNASAGYNIIAYRVVKEGKE